jgi:hypothetical protein
VLERGVGGYLLRVGYRMAPLCLSTTWRRPSWAKLLLEQQIRTQISVREETWRLNEDPPWLPY